MTEKTRINEEVTVLKDSELQGLFPLEIRLMAETNPNTLKDQIEDLTVNLSPKDQELVRRALNFIKPLYGDRKRRYSDTHSILHPYRLALAGDTTAGYKIATKILHDVKEDFGVTDDALRELYKDINGGSDGELIIKGVDAFTRKKIEGKKEDYNVYMKRLRESASRDTQMAYLVGDKVADIVQNCLDPVALPSHIERKIPIGMKGRMYMMLEKYSLGAAVLLDKTDARFRKLHGAMELCRRGQSNNYKLKTA